MIGGQQSDENIVFFFLFYSLLHTRNFFLKGRKRYWI